MFEGPLGMPFVIRNSQELTRNILQNVITAFIDQKRLKLPPDEFHHFTSIDAAHCILVSDDIRLTHAEYSNDQTEISEAKSLIAQRMEVRAEQHTFFGPLAQQYNQRAATLDAYLFCMSTGRQRRDGSPLEPQDILSQWRAYGQDGRGVCLTFGYRALRQLVERVTHLHLRLNPVIYEPEVQRDFVDAILDMGFGAVQHGGEDMARDATVDALVFATPLIKALGFEEENEWRLIFMPPANYDLALKFKSRRDFLAPFVSFKEICTGHDKQEAQRLAPITKVMIGPSGHQSLSERAFVKLINQTRRLGVEVLKSRLPYRSMS